MIDRLRSGHMRMCALAFGAATTIVIVMAAAFSIARAGGAPRQGDAAVAGGVSKLDGRLLAGGKPLAFVPVTLYLAGRSDGAPATAIGTAVSSAAGSFQIGYRSPRGSGAVAYIVAGRGGAVRVASVLGTAPIPTSVVVDEQTTVATGFALAQFITGRRIAGRAPGPGNAAKMAANLVNVRTGRLGAVLRRPPNGSETSTVPTFNSLANMLVPCAQSQAGCGPLFALARPPGSPPLAGTLAAVAAIARNPWHSVRGLFALSLSGPAPDQPALGTSARPGSWILALRFDGDGNTMDGPGNTAFDADGNAWVDNNYTYSADGDATVCGGKLLFEFTPAGRYVARSPFSGGGVNGDGYGITFDPHGNIWVGNFGFSSRACSKPPPHNSVSEFTPDGRALSPNPHGTSGGGFTEGGLSWPQGVVSDRRGDIWIANCGNNTIVRYADGNPHAAVSFANVGLQKPFDIALNRRGQLFITGNGNDAVAMLNPNGTLARPLITRGGFDRPLGIAADSQGNMWVANSAMVNVPCPKGGLKFRNTGSVTLISKNGIPDPKPFTGGGVTAPWGIAVDGNDNVWIANFKGQRVSELCGTEPSKCPPGMHPGQPISPSGGYAFDGLVRSTSAQIDPSGNVWITNNWKLKPRVLKNPGGYQIVVYIGAAKPIRTPLIGPPRPA